MSGHIAIDLDGCLAQYDGWKGMDVIGDPQPGAVEVCHKLVAAGFSLLVFSCRTCGDPFVEGEAVLAERTHREDAVAAIHNWLEKHGFPMMEVWNGDGKPFALHYVDDRAIRCNPTENPQAWQAALEAILND